MARNRLMVALTVVVNGSVTASQTRSRSSSAETGLPWAASKHSKTANSLGLSDSRRPARVADAGGGIQTEVGIAQAAGLGNPGATSQRLDTGEQFGEVEWFGQVIIGTQPEPFDTVFNRSGGGEHQDSALAAFGQQGSANVVAVGTGQVPVQDDDVVSVHPHAGEGLVPVEGHVHGHPVAA